MKYLVNARFLSQKVTGVQRYALSCSLALQDLLGEEVIFVAPQGTLVSDSLKFKNLVQIGCLSGHLWEQVSLASYAKSVGYPYVFCFSGLPPVFYNRSVYCIHDLAIYRYPKAFSRLYGLFYRAMTKIAVTTSSHIFCVSEFTKSEILDILKYDSAFVVNNTLPSEFESLNSVKCDSLDLAYGSPYILAVGSIEPRKNLDRLISAFDRLKVPGLKLIIIGAAGHAFRQSKVVGNHNENIIFGGYISDAYLQNLYSRALCFIYPSLYEGFGIPPLEAMSKNCPVLASNCSSIPEVCGDAALYFNPHSVDAIFNVISKFLDLSQKDQQRTVLLGNTRLMLFSKENQKKQLHELVSSLPN
ncbi:glycosyltransferase family 4 protein [Amylibacter sp.]|nr:glycosyltransferase family 4 protein [Amylibacter sp.]